MNKLRLTINDLQPRSQNRLTTLFCMAVLLAATIFRAPAEESAPAEKIQGRYLIIVETSSSMRRSAENARTVVNKLLLSGMNGELQPGDTLGIWTFNEELYTGKFPLQNWTPEDSKSIAAGADKFLSSQRCEKSGHMEVVIPKMNSVLRNSHRITVLLVTSGDAKMIGTPFDSRINQAYEGNRKELQKLRTPFVTVLRVQLGRFIGCSTSWSPWPVEFPEFLPEPKPVEPSKVEPKQDSTTESRHVAQPLIVIGKKAEPAPPATPSEGNIEASSAATVESRHETASASSKADGKPATIAQGTTPTSESSTVGSTPSSTSVTSEPQTAPVQTAVVSPPEAKSNRTVFLLAGLTALVVGVGLVFMLMRRFRASSSPSLITRSMDRDKE